MAKRVFELARELGVQSKDVLNKCRAEGIDLKNHMAALSAGLTETIRDWFSEEAVDHTAVERAEHVDLEAMREKAEKTRRRRKKAKDADFESPEDEEVAEEEADETAEDEAPAEEAPVEVAEAPQAEEAAEAEAAEPEAAAEPDEEEPEEEEPAEEDEEEEEEPIVPAGPQVVPKPAVLKGPKVIRVEQPDYVPRPQPRRAPGEGGYGAPRGGNLTDERSRSDDAGPGVGRGRRPAASGAPTRRSPRRKGTAQPHGRNAVSEAGEKLREWRDKDLLERKERIHGGGMGLRRRRHGIRSGRGVSGGPSIKSGSVPISEPITIKDLSGATGVKSADIIKKLMFERQIMATVNQVIDTELAEDLMAEYGIELDVTRSRTAEEKMREKLAEREKGELVTRAPVVTFLGHVDHGKTSLLDYIRKTTVADGEAGGITQAIGSYRHDLGDQHVAFLDTPGHEAFTAMRARGANMTDVVVLVVAADDGVMPQTVEAISHAKAAGVPIIVALNKIDVPNANENRALGQLAEHDLQPQEWGGKTEVVKTSAVTGEGIDDLVELLSLEAEILELKAELDAPADGYVIEAEMDPSQGVLATVLNINGTLKAGDIVVAGRGYGRVRAIYSDTGQSIESAGPSMPVSITGLDEVPEAGDRFFVVADLDEARTVAEERRSEDRTKNLARSAGSQPKTLEDILGQIEDGEINEIPIILKADVQGSIEAIVGVLGKLGGDEARLNILHTGVGGITTGDVTLAEASGAIIIGFNVVADATARRLAEQEKVDIRSYRVIYDITEDMRRALEEGLAPEIREEVLGRAEIRQTFKVSRLGTIAGCYVTEGVIQRNAKLRIIRDNVVVESDRDLDSLRRVRDDVREVRAGVECGIKITGYDDVKEGDVLECYKTVEVARTL